MSLIILDGPEKAGKTTLARQLVQADPRIKYRHWGLVDSYKAYYQPLMYDAALPYPVIWDRSWASESVYSNLLDRNRPTGSDPFLAEWLFSRVVALKGVRIILAPRGATLQERRAAAPNTGDLVVDPFAEQRAFVQYGDLWGWSVFSYTTSETVKAIQTLSWRKTHATREMSARIWAGPQHALIVFVGTVKNENAEFQIPFSTEMPAMLGRAIGPQALECGWTNTDCNPDWLRGTHVVSCGRDAEDWCTQNGIEPALVIPHPSWMYRFAAGQKQIAKTENAVRALVNELLPTHRTTVDGLVVPKGT